MASVNKVLLIGSLGKDPQVKHMPNGEAVTNFSIATTESWKDRSGQKQERTEWVNIVMYRKLAEIAGEYLKKGSSVYLEGRLQTREWEKDGIKRYNTEVVCDVMQMLGGRSENKPSGNGNQIKESALISGDIPVYSVDDSVKSEFVDFDDIPFMNPYKFNWRVI